MVEIMKQSQHNKTVTDSQRFSDGLFILYIHFCSQFGTRLKEDQKALFLCKEKSQLCGNMLAKPTLVYLHLSSPS